MTGLNDGWDPDEQVPLEAYEAAIEQQDQAPPATTRGRTPPHNPQAEAAVIGACLLNPKAVTDALEHLNGDEFYTPNHARIWDAICALHTAGTPIDPVTVADQLQTTGHLELVGGTAALVDLETATPTTSNAGHYARIVAQHATLRRLIAAGDHIAQIGWDQPADIGAAVTAARGRIDRIAERVTVGDAIDFENVAAAMRGEVDPVEPAILHRTDGQALIYPGLLHWLMGDPGKGKTWIQLLACAQTIQRGASVMLLDWEGNRRMIGDRLKALGITPEQVEQHLLYWRPPPLTASNVATLAEQVAERRVELVCYDGVAKALARNDYDEDRAPDVLAWLELAVHPLTEQGAAALVLDHLKKDKDGAGLWPRGSGAKQGEVSGAAWKVAPRTAFSRRKAGHFDLIQAKDREGFVGEDGSVVARCHVEPAGELIHLTLDPPDDPGDFKPTVYMERVSRFIEDSPAGELLSQRSIEAAVHGKSELVRDAIAHLVRGGYVERGANGTPKWNHSSVRPYRDDSDSREPIEEF